MPTSFDTLLTAVVTQLAASPGFASVDVLTYKTGDLSSQLSALLASTGIVVLVTLPRVNITKYPTVKPFYDDVTVAVDIIQNVMMTAVSEGPTNTAMVLAQEAVDSLQRFVPLSADPLNANFCLSLEPTGLQELTSPAFIQRTAAPQQLQALASAIGLTSANAFTGLSDGQGYCVVSARFQTQCFPNVLAAA